MPQHFQYVKGKEIDFVKWDHCMETADNSLIYGFSFYLNAMTENWDAIILNDYEAVLPLPWRKKFGIYYLYQPFITAQLGLFGKNIDASMLESCLKKIPTKFRYWDLSLNYQNVFHTTGFPIRIRKNLVLPLNKEYGEIYASYRQTTKRNIKKSNSYVLDVVKDVSVENVIYLHRQQTRKQGGKINEKDYKNFISLFQFLQSKHNAVVYGVLSLQHVLLATAVFFIWNKRAYYILVGNSAESKATGASHRLIDAFIQDHAAQEIVFDFEGSDIENLAFFYSSFGAAEENYAALRYNKLPAFIKWLKP